MQAVYEFVAPLKDPEATLRHGVTWANWLDDGETIDTQSVVASTGLTVNQVSEADGVVSYTVSGGDAGKNYIVTCQISTTAGRIDQRSILYRVRER